MELALSWYLNRNSDEKSSNCLFCLDAEPRSVGTVKEIYFPV